MTKTTKTQTAAKTTSTKATSKKASAAQVAAAADQALAAQTKKAAKAVAAKTDGCATCARALLSGGRCPAHGDPKKAAANRIEAASTPAPKTIEVSSPKTNPQPTKAQVKAKLAADVAEEGKRAEARAQVITLLVDTNPKREGSAAFKAFACYKNGITVGEFLAAGGSMADIRYDQKHNYIRLSAGKK